MTAPRLPVVPKPRPGLRFRRSVGLAAATLLLTTGWGAAALLPSATAAPPVGSPTASTYRGELLTSRTGQVFSPSAVGNPVNDGGLVAGSTRVDGVDRAAVLSLRSRVLTVLGAFPGVPTRAKDINVWGEVAGETTGTNGARLAFVWATTTGRVTELVPPRPATASWTTAINDRGVVVGGLGTTTRAYGLVWNTSTGRSSTLDMDEAVGVDSRGRVIGIRVERTGPPRNRALLWSPGTGRMNVLRPLPGDDSVAPTDLNDSGMIVGHSYSLERDDFVTRPVVWASRHAVPCSLSPAVGNGYAGAVNDRGQVAGVEVSYAGGTHRSVLWKGCGPAGVTLPWPDDSYAIPTGINKRGEVVGSAEDRGVGWASA